MEYVIKEMTGAEIPFLQEALLTAIYVSPGDAPPDRDILNRPEMKKYYTDWGKEHDRGYIAVERRSLEPVGVIWLRRFTHTNPGWGFVDDDPPEISLAVLPQYRNLGIGTTLLQHVIDVTSAIYDALSLSVDRRNPAVHLYARCGFVQCGESGTSITMIRRGEKDKKIPEGENKKMSKEQREKETKNDEMTTRRAKEIQ